MDSVAPHLKWVALLCVSWPFALIAAGAVTFIRREKCNRWREAFSFAVCSGLFLWGMYYITKKLIQ